MKRLKLFVLAALTLIGFSGVANAETVLLASDDSGVFTALKALLDVSTSL